MLFVVLVSFFVNGWTKLSESLGRIFLYMMNLWNFARDNFFNHGYLFDGLTVGHFTV